MTHLREHLLTSATTARTKLNVFVDLDGVLADFDRWFAENHGGETPKQLAKRLRDGDDEMWRRLATTPEFWIELPLMPGAKELWAAIAPYDPIILTGCPKRDFARANRGKRAWVAKHLGEAVPVITCHGKEKASHMFGPGDILIDDFIAHVKRWRKAGGTAILYKDAEQAIREFKEIVAVREFAC